MDGNSLQQNLKVGPGPDWAPIRHLTLSARMVVYPTASSASRSSPGCPITRFRPPRMGPGDELPCATTTIGLTRSLSFSFPARERVLHRQFAAGLGEQRA